MPDFTTCARAVPLDTARNSRAYAEVYLEDPVSGGRTGPEVRLVDTGSDFTILPAAAAVAVGIGVGGLPTETIRTADGRTVSLPKAAGVTLEIEGYAVTADVLFSSAARFAPVVGRLDLMNAFDFGFDTTDWHLG